MFKKPNFGIKCFTYRGHMSRGLSHHTRELGFKLHRKYALISPFPFHGFTYEHGATIIFTCSPQLPKQRKNIFRERKNTPTSRKKMLTRRSSDPTSTRQPHHLFALHPLPNAKGFVPPSAFCIYVRQKNPTCPMRFI